MNKYHTYPTTSFTHLVWFNFFRFHNKSFLSQFIPYYTKYYWKSQGPFCNLYWIRVTEDCIMCCFVVYERVANHPIQSNPMAWYMITYIHMIKNIFSPLSTIVNKSITTNLALYHCLWLSLDKWLYVIQTKAFSSVGVYGHLSYHHHMHDYP